MERKYDNPKIKIIKSSSGMGNKIIVQGGTKLKTDINPKKTPKSTNARSPIATVETTGKNSSLTFTDLIIPTFVIRLVNPPAVPLEKMWKNIIPVIRYIAKLSSVSLMFVKTKYRTLK